MLEMMLKMMVTKTPMKNMMEKTEPRDVPSPSAAWCASTCKRDADVHSRTLQHRSFTCYCARGVNGTPYPDLAGMHALSSKEQQ